MKYVVMRHLFLLLFLSTASITLYSQGRVETAFTFQWNKSVIDWNNAQNKTTLNALHALSNGTTIDLAAYTDTLGSTKYNTVLAKSRLEAVLKLLTDSFPRKFQMNSQQVIGEDHSQATLESNRRVVITVFSTNTTEPKVASSTIRYELGVPFVLKLEFLFGSDELVSHSYREINALVQLMKAEPDLQLTLKGYVCCGPDLNNLSAKRAERIKLALIQAGGISSKRIRALGLGNSKPLFPDDSEEHKQANRRVEATFYKN